MRARSKLGSFVLFAVLVVANAFLLSPTVHKARPVPRPNIFSTSSNKRFVSVSVQNLTSNDDLSVDFVHKEKKEMLKVLDDGLKPARSQGRVQLACATMLLLIGRLWGGSNVFATSEMSKNVVFSTVSASLLRSSTPRWRWSGTHLLLAAAFASQAIQTNNLIRVASAAISSFSSSYMSCLANFPLYTKALTTALIGVAGDATAQFQEERIRARSEGMNINVKNYDRRRGLTHFCDSVFVTGPLLHFAYGFLEYVIPIAGGTGWSASVAALSHMLIDDFILDALFVGIMFVSTGIGEGYTLSSIRSQFKRDFVPAVKASWATSVTLMPLEFCLFRFMPLHLRVLGMNFIDIIWEAVVSFMVHKRRTSHDMLDAPNDSESIPLNGGMPLLSMQEQ